MGINLGSDSISALKLGTTTIDKVYLGSTQIYSSSPGPTPTGPDYGTVVLYGYTQIPNSISNVSGGTISIDDDEGFVEVFELDEYAVLPYQVTIQGEMPSDDYVEIYSVEVYDDNYQWYQVDPGVLGSVCTIVPDESPFTMTFTIDSLQKVVIDTSTTTTRTLVSANEFNQLASDGPQGFVLGSVPVGAVKEVVGGRLITSTPYTFLCGANNLDSLDLSYCTNLTTINDYFLYDSESFNGSITLPSGVTTIGERFLSGCLTFDQDIILPNSVTTIGAGFLMDCVALNHSVVLSNSITSIGFGFMDGCESFNQDISLPSGLLSISNDFMNNCHAFDKPITLPPTLTSIGNKFLLFCTSFNRPLTLPSTLTSIGDSFLSSCSSFNQSIVLPSGITSIRDGFLSNTNFNYPIDLSNITSIGSNFLSGTQFNQPITLPSALTSISPNFLTGSDFNQPIDLSHITSIGASFLAYTPFNQDITLPQLTRIEQYFLANCDHFNKPIVLPNSVTWIGRGFLQYCDSFAQSVTLPSALATVEMDFLYRSDNFVGPLVCNGPSSDSGISSSTTMLSTRSNTAPMYTTGVTLTGPYASVWKNRLPDRTSAPYRKLVVSQ